MNKKRGKAPKKKGKKKGKSKKRAAGINKNSPGTVHYDIDAEEERGKEQEAARDELGDSLGESVDLSLEEEALDESPKRRSLFELQVQRRASTKNTSPMQVAISENIKGRLETLQEIYS